MTKKDKFVVVLTGFGLFRNYESNPSWEAVKLVSLDGRPNVELIKVEVPVVYSCVESVTERIWLEYKPNLVIHCGVSHLATGITLEKRAVQNVDRYCKPDVKQCTPNNPNACECRNFEFLYTNLDVDSICEELNHRHQFRLPFCASQRAGEYLCEYIYRCSLLKDKSRCLFIHVPEISPTVHLEDIATGIQATIETILDNHLVEL